MWTFGIGRTLMATSFRSHLINVPTNFANSIWIAVSVLLYNSGCFPLYLFPYLYFSVTSRFILLSSLFHLSYCLGISSHFHISVLFGMSTCFIFLFTLQFSFSYIILQASFCSSFFLCVIYLHFFSVCPFSLFYVPVFNFTNHSVEILMQNCPLRHRKSSADGIRIAVLCCMSRQLSL